MSLGRSCLRIDSLLSEVCLQHAVASGSGCANFSLLRVARSRLEEASVIIRKSRNNVRRGYVAFGADALISGGGRGGVAVHEVSDASRSAIGKSRNSC